MPVNQAEHEDGRAGALDRSMRFAGYNRKRRGNFYNRMITGFKPVASEYTSKRRFHHHTCRGGESVSSYWFRTDSFVVILIVR
ncbi:hypothetical protein PAECIP111890_03924 [Paenibacillus sp. JJ-223]|nr:hypothetical protein PAECIP111890_03924 [Paenibacillus sp. JJ-223]